MGPATVVYFGLVGVSAPGDLVGRDPYQLFADLHWTTGRHFDPCLLDQFISAVRFMDGGPAQPWWAFTAERKWKHRNNAGPKK